MSRIAERTTMGLHSEEIFFFNQLIIDLKKKQLGREYDPITMERLEEATRMLSKLERCRVKVHFR